MSHKSVSAAMVYLEEWGWVEPAEERKPRKIKVVRETTEKSIENLLVICSDEVYNTEDFDSFYNRLANVWTKYYRNYTLISAGNETSGSVGAKLDQHIKKHASDAILLFNQPLAWGEAALKRLPTYFCGGALPPEELEQGLVNGYCISYPNEFSKVYRLLNSLGHKRILFLYLQQNSGVSDLVLSLPESPKTGDDLLGLPEDYCVSIATLDPELWKSVIEREMTRLQPTAIIALESYSVAAFYSHCYRVGKRIPEDLSIISLSHSPDLEFLTPRPQMLKYSNEAHCKHFESWLKGGLKDIGMKIAPFDWDQLATSVGKAPKIK